MEEIVLSETAIRLAREAVRHPIFKTADDNYARAVGSADYRKANSEVARCYLRLVANTRSSPEVVTVLQGAHDALQAMMDAWFDYHDSHSLTQPVTGAAGNAFDKALAARDSIDAALSKLSPLVQGGR